MIGTIICEVDIIICNIGTINMKFYLLKIWVQILRITNVVLDHF